MNKTALIMILGILGCGKAFAATELQLQQKRVMHFCANASLPLLIAGTTYANTSDNGRPEKERVAILKNSVASSTAYKMASPGVSDGHDERGGRYCRSERISSTSKRS